MKKLSIVLIFFVLIGNSVRAQKNNAFVWINFAECSSCLNSLSFFSEQLTNDINCKLVLKQNDKYSFEEYNNEFFDNLLKVENVIFSDSLYRKYSRNTSTFFVANPKNDSMALEVPFKLLRNYTNLIYSFFDEKIKARKTKEYFVPPAIALSNSVSGKAYENQFVVCDIAFKKFISYDYDTTTRFIFRLDEKNKEKIFKGLNSTQKTYEEYKKTLEKYKEYFPVPYTIGDYTLVKDTLFIGIQLGDYNLNNEGINFYFINGIIAVYNNEIVRAYRLEQHPLSNSVFYNISGPFSVLGNGTFKMSITQDHTDSLLYHSVMAKERADSLTIIQHYKNKLPDYFIRNELYYDLATKIQNNEFEWFGIFPLIISKKNNSEIVLDIPVPDQSLKQILQSVPNGFFLVDVIVENDLLKILYRRDKKYFVSWHDMKGKEVSKSEIEFEGEYNLFSSMSFYKGGNHIVAMPFMEKGIIAFYEIK